MTLLRAVLGRFARFLVRIARRLDPGLAAAPFWVMPEQMAALRVRYPGAPDSWLALVARRTPIDDLLHSLPPEPESPARPPAKGPTFANPEPAPHELASEQRQPRKHRPAVRFPTSGPPSKRLTPREIPISGRGDARISPVAIAARRTRPAQTFAGAAPRHPIADLLRNKGPGADRPILRFRVDDTAELRCDPFQGSPQDSTRREHLSEFPELGATEPDRPNWIATSQPLAGRDEDRPARRWPEPHTASDRDVEWPGKRMVTPRPGLHFSASANRWPDLPSLDEDSTAPPQPTADEAARSAEQIGGAWSG
jgi:hypothetical protein